MTFYASHEMQVCFNCKREFVRYDNKAGDIEAGKYIKEHISDMPISPSKRITYEMRKLLDIIPYQVYKCPYCGYIIHSELDILCAMCISAKHGKVSETIFGMTKEEEG